VNFDVGADLSNKFPILSGRYSEFTVSLYETVGIPIVILLMTNR
jgi:hypothetical protein